MQKHNINDVNQLLVQGGNAAESSGLDAISAAMDGCATDRSSYTDTSGRAECEAAAPSAGHVLALAGSTGTDWRVGFKPVRHVFVVHHSNVSQFSMFASVLWK